MSKVYMISDPHFGHKSMSEKRGFKTVEEHDKLIVDNWNSKVTKRDKVFLLGDITMEKANYNILEKLKGNITVVLGNHDLPNHSKELLKYVDNVAGAIKYKGCILTHIPIHESEVDRFRLNIHGHIHDGVIEDYRYFNVSSEAIDYTPIEFDKIIEIYLERKYNKNMKTILSRVEEESVNYESAEHAAIDHLKMASAHLFEETGGRDVDSWLSDIEKIVQKLENRINS